MTRQEIYAAYEVDERGIVQSPGQYENEPAYAVAFWEWAQDGECLTWPDAADVWIVDIDASDRAEWPELGDAACVRIWQDESGFVFCDTLSDSEYAALRAENDAAWSTHETEEV